MGRERILAGVLLAVAANSVCLAARADRVVQGQLGRLLFLKRSYPEGIAELRRVLAIDPEDLQAHYNLMLCYRGVGDREMAKKHEALYRRFKADESAQKTTGPYRQLHPHDDNERQAVHEHASALDAAGPEGSPRSATAGGAR
jgi:tetratricopeptide (TPR) repeat protein